MILNEKSTLELVEKIIKQDKPTTRAFVEAISRDKLKLKEGELTNLTDSIGLMYNISERFKDNDMELMTQSYHDGP